MKSIYKLGLLLVGLMVSSLGFASSSDCLGKGEGGKAFQRGSFLAAARHWENARQRISKNTREYINTSVCLANAYLRLGRLKAAFRVLKNAQSRAETINDSVSRAKVLMGLSDVYLAVRDYQDNRTNCGIQQIRETIIPFAENNSLSEKKDKAQNTRLSEEKILDKIEVLLKKAEKSICQNPHPDYQLQCAKILNKQGRVFSLQVNLYQKLFQQGDKYYEKPILRKEPLIGAKYQKSKQLANQVGDQVLSVQISIDYVQHAVQFYYFNKVQAEQRDRDKQEQTEQSQKAMQSSLKDAQTELGYKDKQGNTLFQRAEKLPNSHDKTSALISLAQLVRDLPSSVLPKATKQLLAYNLLTKAFKVAEADKGNFYDDDSLSMAYIKGYLAELYAEEQRYPEAIRLMWQAIFHAQSYPEFQNYPELLSHLEWQLGTYFKKQGMQEKAIKAYQRAANYLQQVRKYYGRVSQSVRYLEKKVYFEQADLLLQKAASAGETQALLREAIDTIESFKAAELRNYFQDECVTELEKKVKKVDEILPPNTAAFYPLVFDDRVELLLISNNRVNRLSSFNIKKAGVKKETKCSDEYKKENFRQTVKCFRRSIEKEEKNYLKKAQSLYDWLIRPLTKKLSKQVKILVIVPNDELYTIPFAALHDRKEDKFLIEQYALAVTPGLKLTDPVRPMLRRNVRALLAGSDFVELRNKVYHLPCVPLELSQISCLLTTSQVTHIKEEDFTTATACSNPSAQWKNTCALEGNIDVLPRKVFNFSNMEKRFNKTSYSIVHIATHGRFDSDPNKTFLQTFDGKKLNKITMNDLERLIGITEFRTQPIDLLTLSACETAKGDKRAALGLAGVALKAGARSVLATLWPVKDPSTAWLVSEFYQQSQNASKARALQAAQKKLLRNKYKHPYYWAPFLLIGNWF
jgi:CHAT domain-containing protein